MYHVWTLISWPPSEFEKSPNQCTHIRGFSIYTTHTIQVSIACEDRIKTKLSATSCLTQCRPSPSHEARQATDSTPNRYSLSTTKDPTLAWRWSHRSISLRHSIWRIFRHGWWYRVREDVSGRMGDCAASRSCVWSLAGDGLNRLKCSVVLLRGILSVKLHAYALACGQCIQRADPGRRGRYGRSRCRRGTAPPRTRRPVQTSEGASNLCRLPLYIHAYAGSMRASSSTTS
jgi:hypothetical protein